MSRYRVLVLGPARRLAASLEPFDESIRVSEYFTPVQQWLLDHVAKELTDPHNSPAVARRLSSLVGALVFVKDGVWGYNSTYNPDARWASWSVVPLPCRPNAEPVSTLCKGDLDTATWERWLEWGASEETYSNGPLGDYWPDVDELYTISGFSSIEEIPRLGARAVLGEGVWQEPGQVGWFGTSTATVLSVSSYWEWYVRFWNDLPKEAELTLVECDI